MAYSNKTKSRISKRGNQGDGDDYQSIVRKVALEQRSVTIAGKRQKLTIAELILTKLSHKAAQGTISALKTHQKLFEKYGPQPEIEGVGYLIAPAEMSPEEWLNEQMEKNKTHQKPNYDFDIKRKT